MYVQNDISDTLILSLPLHFQFVSIIRYFVTNIIRPAISNKTQINVRNLWAFSHFFTQ